MSEVLKIAQLRQQSDDELTKLLAQQRERLSELIVEYKTKDIKDVRAMRSCKKQVARILTLLRQRQIQAEEAAHA